MRTQNTRPAAWGLALLVFGALTGVSIAQEKPKLTELRKGQFAAKDRGAVQTWLEGEVKKLFAAKEPEEAIALGAQLFYEGDGLVRHYKAADATAQFKEGLARTLADVFLSAYKAQPVAPAERHPLSAVYPLITLREFNQPKITLDCFFAALADPYPGPRLAAAEGLLTTRETMTNPQWQALLPRLQVTAAKETSDAALGQMYGIFNVQNKTRAAEAVAVVLDILETRLTRDERAGRLPLPADAEAVTWLGEKMRQSNDDATHKKVTLAAARLLADAVHPYVNGKLSEDQQERLEKIIYKTETQLTVLFAAKSKKTAPEVIKIMGKLTEDRPALMAEELNKWIGSDDREGLLNSPPFGFKPGLGIERPEHSADTRPAAR